MRRTWCGGLWLAAGLCAALATLPASGARAALGGAKPGNREVNEYLKELKNKDMRVREEAARLLGVSARYRDFSKIIPALAEALDDPDPWVQFYAYNSLRQLTGNYQLERNRQAWARWWEANKSKFKGNEDDIRTRLEREKADVSNNMGILYLASGQYRASEAEFMNAIKIAPKIGYYHNNLGLALFHQMRYEEALASFRSALRCDKNLDCAYSNIGDTYDEMAETTGQLEYFNLARNYYQTARKLDEDKTIRARTQNWKARHGLARIYLRERRYEESLEYCLEAIKIAPIQPEPWLTKSLAHYGLDQYYLAYKSALQVGLLGWDWEKDEYLDRLEAKLAEQDQKIPEELKSLREKLRANPPPPQPPAELPVGVAGWNAGLESGFGGTGAEVWRQPKPTGMAESEAQPFSESLYPSDRLFESLDEEMGRTSVRPAGTGAEDRGPREPGGATEKRPGGAKGPAASPPPAPLMPAGAN